MEELNPMNMAHWPGTPGEERLRRAEEIISRDARCPTSRLDDPGAVLAPEERDARMLTRFVEQIRFTGWSSQEIERLSLAEQINHPLDLADIAIQGSGPSFIGMLIQTDEPARGRRHHITRLFRHPEWVGLNHLLPLLTGLEVHVFGGVGEGYTPMMVVGSSRWNQEEDGTIREPGTELAAAIREAVMWHGATDCRWHGPETGRHPGTNRQEEERKE